jgi:hypothetical protein
MKKICFIVLSLLLPAIVAPGDDFLPQMVGKAANGKGLLCRYQGKSILFVEGSPEEMGTAHGQLRAGEIHVMREKIMLVAAGYMLGRDDWFFTRIEEVMNRTAPFTPERFYTECDAMSAAAGLPAAAGRQINFFPEMFHCSGAAVRGAASAGGQVVHARVLDYMRDIDLQRCAQLTVFLPEGRHGWISLGYAGLVGTVTAMNDQGLAMGQMGGDGYGKWDGLPMALLMRRVMEECATVEEALALLKSVPLTCDYYYVLSDKQRDLAAVTAIAGEPLRIFGPGEQDPALPPVPPDAVYISKGERAGHLSWLLREHYGKIDATKMIEIIRRPVAMSSNLHNAIFLPESGVIYFSDAGAKTVACDEPYVRVEWKELLAFYRAAKSAAR